MPSNAFSVHLQELLRDSEELDDLPMGLRAENPGKQQAVEALDRASVVMSVSAWESYIEELMREAVESLRPSVSPLGAWELLNRFVGSRIAGFNTPSSGNVDRLILECVGLDNVSASWIWQDSTSAQAVQKLAEVMKYRHQIAHGVNPRPVILKQYTSELPEFFRRLALSTDDVVRNHLVGVHGIAAPWPP